MTEKIAPHSLKIGVLALQGAFLEHIKLLEQVGVDVIEVRKAEQLDGLDALVIPGGESTSMGLIAERWGLVDPLREWVQSGKPTWGTCAGMIMLADRAEGQKLGGQTLIGGLDVLVSRNHFGRQVDSFETDMLVADLGVEPFRAIFIRAPAILEVGADVEILAHVETHQGETVIAAVKQGPILATAFHPELTTDPRWHQFFVDSVSEIKRKANVAQA